MCMRFLPCTVRRFFFFFFPENNLALLPTGNNIARQQTGCDFALSTNLTLVCKKPRVYKRSMFGCTHCLGEGFVLVTSSISLCVCPTWRFPWLWTRLSWPQRAFVRPWFNPMAMLSLSLSSAGLEGKLVLPPEKNAPGSIVQRHNARAAPVNEWNKSGAQVAVPRTCLRLLLTPFCVVVSNLPTYIYIFSLYLMSATGAAGEKKQ